MRTSRLIFAAIFLLTLSPLAASQSFAGGTSVSITHSDIAAYKAALKLTPMQQVYWVPVAAALKSLPTEGKMINIDASTINRLMPVLRPLLASLGDDQKRVAAALAHRMGLGQYASLM